MSRCRACDARLNRRELGLKAPDGSFLDLCGRCISGGSIFEDNNPFQEDLKDVEIQEVSHEHSVNPDSISIEESLTYVKQEESK